MSCWVVPTLAAELWGVPLEQVMCEIRAGAVVSKLDYGFTLVDVAPDSRELAPPPVRKPVPAPMTFVPAGAFEEAEEVATEIVARVHAIELTPEPSAEPVRCIEPAASNGYHLPLPASNNDDESEDGPDPNFGEPDDGKPLDWRAARTRSASQRRRPPSRFN